MRLHLESHQESRRAMEDREGSGGGVAGSQNLSPADGDPSLRRLRGGAHWLTRAWYLKTSNSNFLTATKCQ